MVSLYLEKATTNDQNRCALFRPVTSHQEGWRQVGTQPPAGQCSCLLLAREAVPAPLAVTRKEGRGHCSLLGSTGGPASPESAERDTSEVILKH